VVVPGLFGQDKLDGYVRRLDAIVSEEVSPADGMLVMRDVMVAKERSSRVLRWRGSRRSRTLRRIPN
jgi:hypothetical protein